MIPPDALQVDPLQVAYPEREMAIQFAGALVASIPELEPTIQHASILNPFIKGLSALGARYFHFEKALLDVHELRGQVRVTNNLSMRILSEEDLLVEPPLDRYAAFVGELIGDKAVKDIMHSPPPGHVVEALLDTTPTYVIAQKGFLASLALKGILPWEERFATVSPTPDQFLDFPHYHAGGKYRLFTPQDQSRQYVRAIEALKPAAKRLRNQHPRYVQGLARKAIDTYQDHLSSLELSPE